MELEKAKELLPYFQEFLTNRQSIMYEKKVLEIFIGFEDFRLTESMYPMAIMLIISLRCQEMKGNIPCVLRSQLKNLFRLKNLFKRIGFLV